MQSGKSFSIVTLGCKVNQFESEALAASLEEIGYRIVATDEAPDFVIVNTCTVTQKADFQSRQMVRRAIRANPGARVIVTGCYAEVQPRVLSSIDGVSHILGNAEKPRLPDILPLIERGTFPRITVSGVDGERNFIEMPLRSYHFHTRAFLKIQDGCDARCAYCIVPIARGRSRSLPPEKVFRQISLLKESGYAEVVLTGIHIGAYGKDLNPRFSLSKLLEGLERIDSPVRIRLSSIEPLDFTSEMVTLVSRSRKICRHIHIPVQSGDDEILMRMNRPYSSSFVYDLVAELHSSMPDCCIGADIIVGFPGETERHFERTLRMVEELPFSYLHVFPFSRREGTAAYYLSPSVENAEIKMRTNLLRQISDRKRAHFYSSFRGEILDVLVEDRHDKATGFLKGISRNFIPVLLQKGDGDEQLLSLINQEIKMLVTDVSGTRVAGRICG